MNMGFVTKKDIHSNLCEHNIINIHNNVMKPPIDNILLFKKLKKNPYQTIF